MRQFRKDRQYNGGKKQILEKRRRHYPKGPLSPLLKKFLIKRDEDGK